MSNYDLKFLDTLETTDHLKGATVSTDLNIPAHMLPSQTHLSYPYGNPTNVKHPASRPRPSYVPSSRTLFEDMGYDGGSIKGALRWKDLAIEYLLPVDEEKEEEKRSIKAWKMASGASNAAAPQAGMGQDHTAEEDENENDEDDKESEGTEGEDEDEEEEG
ncbi:hypothetical protein B0H17DRAFT_1156028 [Mycena rosella]|uniref:Uncharacterized protein n=1 Tax=Mycena rosella TaxID=1033263 RepID=A0AAD7MAM0_MYCRO|nr:hypothetical protein B0H17DRAFT_1156028 [Mycena rosella]